MEGCSSPLEISAWRTGRPQKANTLFPFSLSFLAHSWGLAQGCPLGFPLPSWVLHPSQGLTATCLAEVEEFVMVPLHAKPSSAADEIDALYDVYTDVVNKWATNVSGGG